MKPPSHAATRERLLFYLKTRGPQSAAQLGRRLRITAVGARQHLAVLHEEGLVEFRDERRPVGRPARIWSLSEQGGAAFPEGYGDLAVDILTGVRETFGASGLARLVQRRTRTQLAAYGERMPPGDAPLGKRVAALARLRTEEGYMAEWSRRGGEWELVENHCPVCAAAEVCQGLCDGELELFQSVLGDDVCVERTEHLLDGARRCVYRVRPR